MSTTEQQAGAAERAAVERLARWLGKTDTDPPWFHPFTDAGDERELLTAVQERWGKDGLEAKNAFARLRWNAFVVNMRRSHPSTGFPLSATLYLLKTGDVARAVDAVLREYPE